MASSLKRNFALNAVYQVLSLILPMITIPYVSRVLGADGIGEYSYTYSIVYYFVIVAMLGFNNYGNRTIARYRHDRKKLSKKFAEIYSFQVIMSCAMVLLYILYLLFINSEYSLVATIQVVYLIACIFDINWFFFGLEEFKLTVSRNIFIKLLSLVMIFMFVKSSTDVWIYTLILSSSTLLSQLVLLPFLFKHVDFVRIKLKDLRSHVAPCFGLFLPVIASTIYRTMDKTMIGWFADMSEVGIYENAEKMITVPTALITALGTVMLPRMSNMYAKKNSEEISPEAVALIDKSIQFVMFLSFAMMAGIIAVGNGLAIIFFGDGFPDAGIIMAGLSVTIPMMAWGNVVRTQYLIPKNEDKTYILSAFCGAMINLAINLIFIPRYAAMGACFGTIIAELVVVVYQTLAITNKLPFLVYVRKTIPFLLKALVMLAVVLLISEFLNIDLYLRVIVQILCGILVYLIMNYKYMVGLIKK